MQFKQFYLGCLAHASYLVGDDGVCAIVDPQRDVDQYIDEAAARGLEIRHIIETHLHADFVSGHLELARRTGARIHIGRRAQVAYDHVAVADGDRLSLGKVELRFLETPGHTPESLCVLVYGDGLETPPTHVLTGDTLFIGDVGRPDLVGSQGLSSEEMAGMMYDSLRQKLMTLPDEVEVFPAHGAGSACGKNISSALSCTIGQQKQTNHALQDMSKDQFVKVMTLGLMPPPRYFPESAELNRQGALGLDELPPLQELSPEQVQEHIGKGGLVLDTRDAARFGSGHLPGSVNIGLEGNFAPWVGTLLDASLRCVLVVDDAQSDEAVKRLSRVGRESVVGHLAGGVEAWQRSGRPLATIAQWTVDELQDRLDPELVVLDVRKPGEYEGGHVPGAVNIPVEQLERRIDELNASRATAVICATGYRSSAASSLLVRRGFGRLHNVTGGTVGWIEAGHPTEAEASVG
jgi:hydroxyacylglutathione hydrolase